MAMRAVGSALGALLLAVVVNGCGTGDAATPDPHSLLAVNSVLGPRDGRTFAVEYWGNECDSLKSAAARESEVDVVLELQVRVDDGPCSDVAYAYRTTITLTDPLGDRVIIDGHSGREVPLNQAG